MEHLAGNVENYPTLNRRYGTMGLDDTALQKVIKGITRNAIRSRNVGESKAVMCMLKRGKRVRPSLNEDKQGCLTNFP